MILRFAKAKGKLCLYIDTKDQKVIRVSLKKSGKVVKSLTKENQFGSQILLPLITKILRMHTSGVQSQSQTRSGNWNLVEGIEVETGPGSFTGLRVGVSVANALGFSLGIPVNGKKIEDKLVY